MMILLLALVTVTVARTEQPTFPQYLPPSNGNGGSRSPTYGTPGLGGSSGEGGVGNEDGFRDAPYISPNLIGNVIGGKPSLLYIISIPGSNGISVDGHSRHSSYEVPGLNGLANGHGSYIFVPSFNGNVLESGIIPSSLHGILSLNSNNHNGNNQPYSTYKVPDLRGNAISQPSYIYLPSFDGNGFGNGNTLSPLHGVPSLNGNGHREKDRPFSTYQPSLSGNSNNNGNFLSSSKGIPGHTENEDDTSQSNLYSVPGFNGTSEGVDGTQPPSESRPTSVGGGNEYANAGNVGRHPDSFSGGSIFYNRQPPNSYLPPRTNVSGLTKPDIKFRPPPVDGGFGLSNGGNVMDANNSPSYGVPGFSGTSGGVGGPQQPSEFRPPPVDDGNKYANAGNIGRHPGSLSGGSGGGSGYNNRHPPNSYLPPNTVAGGNRLLNNGGNVMDSNKSPLHGVPGLNGTSGVAVGIQQPSGIRPPPVGGGNEYANAGNVGRHPGSFSGGSGGGSGYNNRHPPNTYLPPNTVAGGNRLLNNGGNVMDSNKSPLHGIPGLNGTSGVVVGTQQPSGIRPPPIGGGNEYANAGNMGRHPGSFSGGSGGGSRYNIRHPPNSYLPPRKNISSVTKPDIEFRPPPVDGGFGLLNGGNVINANNSPSNGVPGLSVTNGGVGGTQQPSELRPGPVGGRNEYATAGNMGRHPGPLSGGSGGGSGYNNRHPPNAYLPPNTVAGGNRLLNNGGNVMVSNKSPLHGVPGLNGTSGVAVGIQQPSGIRPPPVGGGNEYANAGNMGRHPGSFSGGSGGGSGYNNRHPPNTYLPPNTVAGGNRLLNNGGNVMDSNKSPLHGVPGLNGTSGVVVGTQQPSGIRPPPIGGGNEYANAGNMGRHPGSFSGGSGGGSGYNNRHPPNTYLPPNTVAGGNRLLNNGGNVMDSNKSPLHGVPGLNGTSGVVVGIQQPSGIRPPPVGGGNEYANAGNMGRHPGSFSGGSGGGSGYNIRHPPNSYLPPRKNISGVTKPDIEFRPPPVDGGFGLLNGGNVIDANNSPSNGVPGLSGTNGGVGGTQQPSELRPAPVGGRNEYENAGNMGRHPGSLSGGSGGGSGYNNRHPPNAYLPPKTYTVSVGNGLLNNGGKNLDAKKSPLYGVPGLNGTSGGVVRTQKPSEFRPPPVADGNEYANPGNMGRHPGSLSGGSGGGSGYNNRPPPNSYLPPKKNISGLIQPDIKFRPLPVDGGDGFSNGGNVMETIAGSSETEDSDKGPFDVGLGGKYLWSTVPAKLEFNYAVSDAQHGTQFGHQETRDGDQIQGSYTVLLPDGRKQIVDYVADHKGYRTKIRYEEPNDISGENFDSQPGLHDDVKESHMPELSGSANRGYPPSRKGVKEGHIPELSGSANAGYPPSLNGVKEGHIPELSGSANAGYPPSLNGVKESHMPELSGSANGSYPPSLNGVNESHMPELSGSANGSYPPSLNGVNESHMPELSGSANGGYPPSLNGVNESHMPELSGSENAGYPPSLNGLKEGHMPELNVGGNVDYPSDLNAVRGGHIFVLNGGGNIHYPLNLNGGVRGGHIFVLNGGGNVGSPAGLNGDVKGGHIFLLNGGGNVGLGLNDGVRSVEGHGVGTNRHNGYALGQTGSGLFWKDGYRD